MAVLFAAPALPDELKPSGEVIEVRHDFSNQPVPKWENGFVLGREAAIDKEVVTSCATPSIFAFDRTGTLVLSRQVSVPDATCVTVFDMAASADGTVAAAGRAVAQDGKRSRFIAWIAPSGAIQQVVRTDPFGANRICFSDDGVLWALGRELIEGTNDVKPDYDLVRRYGPDGRLLGSLLRRSSFPAGRKDPAIRALLASGAGRVGLYSTNAGRWIEFAPTGEVLVNTTTDPGAGEPVGLVMNSKGHPYVTWSELRTAEDSVSRLDTQSGKWIPVTVNDMPEWRGILAGADGPDLLLHVKGGRFMRLYE